MHSAPTPCLSSFASSRPSFLCSSFRVSWRSLCQRRTIANLSQLKLEISMRHQSLASYARCMLFPHPFLLSSRLRMVCQLETVPFTQTIQYTRSRNCFEFIDTLHILIHDGECACNWCLAKPLRVERKLSTSDCSDFARAEKYRRCRDAFVALYAQPRKRETNRQHP